MPILKIEKLTKKYGKTYALNGLDMEVKKGDIYGFVGPNGAGKTTTLRIISGLLKSDGGDLWLDGVRTTKNILKQKSLIGFVPDFFGVYENLNVIEYLEFFAASYGIYGRAGTVRDFVAVGDVDIRVIGADNQFIATEVPVRQLLEQIVAKLGLPPFLLGLSWSSTERMSSQQSDLLTGELESYRRLLTPVLAKIAGLYLRSQGFAPEVAVEWAPISLQDETEEATARLTRAKAEELERKLAHEAKQEGTV